MRALFVACAVAFAAGIGGAQQPGSSQAAARFEVVSVKPAAPPVSIQGFNFTRPPQDHWQVGNLTLEEIIKANHPEYAFPGLITGGEAWTREARFDIDARKDPKASPADVQVMVDRMLAERFALRTHLEPRPMNVYLLKVARADGPLGPTIARSRQACVEARVQQLPVASWPEECRTSRFPRPTGRGSFVNLMAGEMSELTRTLGRMRIDRPILDRTGLSGRFDAALHWNQPEAAAPPTGEETLSLFTAIKEQLGLELAAGREMVNVLVVDGATRPSEN